MHEKIWMSHDDGERNDVKRMIARKREKAKLILEKKNKRYIGSFEYRVNRFRFLATRERESRFYPRYLSEYR